MSITATIILACLSTLAEASDNVLSSKFDFPSNPSTSNSTVGSVEALTHSLGPNFTVIINRNRDEELEDLERQQQKLNFIGYLLLSSFLLVLTIVLVLLIWNLIRARDLLFENDTPRANRSMKMRIQRRYETIEHWIITKSVQSHGSFSDTVVDNFGHHQSNSQKIANEPANGSEVGNDGCKDGNDGSTADVPVAADAPKPAPMLSARLDDDEPRECPICMSTLKAGQIVSWSANEKCNHTYHHQCIKEWLLRHVDCCLCKEVFLPVDEKKGKAKQGALQELSCRYAASSATSFFCEKRGLVRIPRSVRCTRAELGQLEQLIFDGTVPPAKLVDLRGGRPDCTTTSYNGDADFAIPVEGLIYPASTAETLSYDGEEEDDDENLTVEAKPPLPQADSVLTTSLPFSPVRVPKKSLDVELGSAELLSASYHLEKNKSAFGDNRCCVEDSGDSVEVHETSSSQHIVDEEDEESVPNRIESP